MKLKTLIFLFFLIASNAFSQTETYLDINRLETKKKDAKYLQVTEKIGTKYVIKEYLIQGNVLIKKMSLKSIKSQVKDGPYEAYYDNGNIREKGNYTKDKKTGIWEEYYEEGNIKSKYQIRNDTANYYHQYWNSNGDPILSNGNGILRWKDEKLERNLTMNFKDSLLYSGFFTFFNETDTIYYILKRRTEYKGGPEAFYAFVGNQMRGKYPAQARRMGIEGRVFVEFVVNPEWGLEHVKVIRGIGAGCDEVAMETLRKSEGNWIPGEHEGRKVKNIMVMPFVFKLN